MTKQIDYQVLLETVVIAATKAAERAKQENNSDLLKDDLEISLSPLKTDLAVLKWMIGILIAGVMSLVLKTFFT